MPENYKPDPRTIHGRESFQDPHTKVAFFAEGTLSGVVEALHRAAEQLNGRQMKQYNSPASNPTEIRWFKQ